MISRLLERRIAGWLNRKIDWRRFPPFVSIGLFMAVTISHEASYAGSFEPPGIARLLGWPYAVALNLSIVTAGYFTQWVTTRKWAWIGFFAFTLASGGMNTGWIKPWLLAGWEEVFAWVFSLLPTMAIAMMGFLAGNVGKLAHNWELAQARKIEKKREKQRVKPKPEKRPESKDNDDKEEQITDDDMDNITNALQRARVLSYYRRNPQTSLNSASKDIGVTVATLTGILTELEKEGKVNVDDNEVTIIE